MDLKHGLHLAYCTNIHRAETWAETQDALERFTLAVRDQVSVHGRFAIGLRLSDCASRELSKPDVLQAFRKWLECNRCYVFTINGFPFGQFHATRVKEQVYWPDWTQASRLEFTNRLFNILAELLPPGVEGSVSTLPGSFKEFIRDGKARRQIHENLWKCAEHIEEVSAKSGKRLHLGLEPEPLGLFENTEETLAFFNELQSNRPGDDRLRKFIGVNYDTCHFAVEYDDPAKSIQALRNSGIRISKLHLSSALKLSPNEKTRAKLRQFCESTYLHQVIARTAEGQLIRYKDLPEALADPRTAEEWRVHFHIPLHAEPQEGLTSTRDHLLQVLDQLAVDPSLCSHLEMETYTWDVLPTNLREADVVRQLSSEYSWTLSRLAERGLAL